MKTLLVYSNPYYTCYFEELIFLEGEGIARLTAYLRKYGFDISQESLGAKCSH